MDNNEDDTGLIYEIDKKILSRDAFGLKKMYDLVLRKQENIRRVSFIKFTGLHSRVKYVVNVILKDR